jgi:hypothetical protein
VKEFIQHLCLIKPQSTGYPAPFADITPNEGYYQAFYAGYDENQGFIKQPCRLIIVERTDVLFWALETIQIAISARLKRSDVKIFSITNNYR